MMNVRPIRTEADHDWALGELEAYFRDQPKPGTEAGDRFEVLATLVEAYEAKQWALPEIDPIDILNAAIDDMGHDHSELAVLLGSRSHASEVLARKRPLSLDMIRSISEAWALPASLLVPRYKLTDVA